MDFNVAKELGFVEEVPEKFRVHPEAVLSPDEIAAKLGVSGHSVRRWCREGKLPCYSFSGKFIITGKDFMEFVQRSRITKVTPKRRK